ncbi:DUF547 domain-containing protein [Legionella micdadei]|uniref:DUF547 domain-containing protein n=2 Tax=Legionella micdadei TaxID=451 RepID=A0A098GD78_LEGMI|nr:DUF547 domain-containing protein [Legionella micdadei]ARH01142.1 DUF547 domain-containing protein [Legionella micdadei]KTD30403.1 putative Ser/Thr protein kinase [Legionella micdadei]NSL18322.1 DUF547 domain-containing protein [Legionella micdadei]CEG59927.1 conserved exported protein of unknown function [Legionella micdadei]
MFSIKRFKYRYIPKKPEHSIFTLLKYVGYILFISLTLVMSNAHASFNKNLWPEWEVNNPLSRASIDHSDWQEFLNRRVLTNQENINLVDYSHLTDEDYTLLQRYIEKMSKIDINNYNRNEQLAFWINLYNALTVQIIADYYPVGSVEEINISPGLFSIGPWGKKVVTINGVSLSLDEIQNRIIRPIWNDQRTLYAINNGSIGAANLSKQAYRGSTIDAALNEAAFNYVNSLRGAQVIEGALVVSKIYDWFNEDFGGTKKDVITHLKQFAKEPLSSQLKHINDIDNYVYNWHLNSTVSSE